MSNAKEFEEAILKSAGLFSPQDFPTILGDFFTDGATEQDILDIYEHAARILGPSFPLHSMALRSHALHLMEIWGRSPNP